MTWDQNYATQWGQANGYLKPGQIATGGALDAAINAGGPQALQAYKQAIDASNANPNATPPGDQPLTVAGLNDYQKNALYGMGQPSAPINPNIASSFASATTAANSASTPYDYNSYSNFLNPYIDQVINNNAADIKRTYDVQRNGINEDSARNGGFGSTAQGTAQAQTNEAEARQVGDMSASLRAQGFNDATTNSLGLYNSNRANSLNTANTFQNIGNNYQNLDAYGRNVTATDQNRQLTAGNQIQGQNQAQLDSYTANRNAAQQYPYQQTNFLQGVVGPYSGTNTTSTTPGVGAAQGAAGGGILGYQVGNYLNGGGNSYSPTAYGNYSSQGKLPWQTPGTQFPIY